MAARALAALLARPYRAWRDFSRIDAATEAAFRAPEDFAAHAEAVRESNAALRRAHMQDYARAHLLPRLDFDGGWPRLRARAPPPPGAAPEGL